ncbi:MAG: hypothetical protein KIT35_14325 [Piscinibacter sp.]|uniref:hypothetical protein n=1 Tax=Piscinibacter sp. TaxID=1903157 RepID=UPI00258587E8|nr:hypothetical protein [Piscinibacter sp.]MCW5665011.1 hypothetical protein [Piscinibacter sp.]
MSQAPIPTKTPLGQDALRRRTGELGQRHRTILFLIDGRRTLAEVLGLAHQAGAATTHFEDLVRLGYVQLPAEEPPAPPPPELPELAQPPAEAQITHLEVEVPADAALPAPPTAAPVPAAAPVPETWPAYADTVPAEELPALEPPPAPEPRGRPQRRRPCRRCPLRRRRARPPQRDLRRRDRCRRRHWSTTRRPCWSAPAPACSRRCGSIRSRPATALPNAPAWPPAPPS